MVILSLITALYNNNDNYHGGGVSIYLYGKDSTEFNNCSIHNNRAQHTGRGVYINLLGNGSIGFHHCTIYNNIVQQELGGGGGGVSIYSKHSSIKFNNCTIHNNTGQHAGGERALILSFGNGSIDFCKYTIYINTALKKGGGVYIYSDGNSSFKFSNCIIYNNTAYLGSSILLSTHQFTLITSFLFTNVSFYFNIVPNKNDVYQAAVALVNIYGIIFDQIELSNHNTTGLMSFNSVITFDKNNTFENNGGGIPFYNFSKLLLKKQTYIYFVNNHARSGGGIFVSQLRVPDIYIKCSFQVTHNSKGLVYFVNDTANISGVVLYGGKIGKCNFDNIFYYPQQAVYK